MIGYIENDVNKCWVYIHENGVKMSFSVWYGKKIKGKKADFAEPPRNEELKDIKTLSDENKRVCIEEVFDEWYYETPK